jgi:hypothetical protein
MDMPKQIETLVSDIYEVLDGQGGWERVVTDYYTEQMSDMVKLRFEDGEPEREPKLRMSGLGAPCVRKVWYGIHEPHEAARLAPSTRFKFLYGDVVEVLLISLAMAAGHRVEGCQDELEIGGIKGHRDCVIDGVTIDVKSASPFAFKKFQYGQLREDDPFGYISQLSSYVYAGRDNPVESHPTRGAFLVADKVAGTIVLDEYDLTAEVEAKEGEIERIKAATAEGTTTPLRGFPVIEDGYKARDGTFRKNGNHKLGLNCSYCDYREHCHPTIRTFMYKQGMSSKPVYFTKVVKAPNVPELT